MLLLFIIIILYNFYVKQNFMHLKNLVILLLLSFEGSFYVIFCFFSMLFYLKDHLRCCALLRYVCVYLNMIFLILFYAIVAFFFSPREFIFFFSLDFSSLQKTPTSIYIYIFVTYDL